MYTHMDLIRRDTDCTFFMFQLAEVVYLLWEETQKETVACSHSNTKASLTDNVPLQMQEIVGALQPIIMIRMVNGDYVYKW